MSGKRNHEWTQATAWDGALSLQGDIVPATQQYRLTANGRGMDSALLFSEVMALVHKAGLTLTHADVTIIAQTPKISPHRELMRKNLCALLQLESGAVNVKATTEERLGFTGRKEGIKAVAVVSALK